MDNFKFRVTDEYDVQAIVSQIMQKIEKMQSNTGTAISLQFSSNKARNRNEESNHWMRNEKVLSENVYINQESRNKNFMIQSTCAQRKKKKKKV